MTEPTVQPQAAQPGGTEPAVRTAGFTINHLQLAVLSALLCGVLALGTRLGDLGLLIAVAVVQAVLVPCWVLGTGLPGRIGALLLGLLTAAGADAATTHWHDSGYSPVLGVLGVAIPLMFAHQLTRGVVRTRVVESMAGIALLLIAVAALTGLIVLRRQGTGETVTLALIAAIGVGLVVDQLTDAVLPAPRFDPAIDRGLPAVIAGVLAGALVALLTLRHDIDFASGRGGFFGAAVAAVACLLSIGATFTESRAVPPAPSGSPADDAAALDTLPAAVSPRLARLRPAAAVALTIALSVPAGYVLINALTG